MSRDDRDFAERWRMTVRNMQAGIDRMQRTADGFSPDIAVMAGRELGIAYARHAEAFADHTVALNCLNCLINGRLDGDF